MSTAPGKKVAACCCCPGLSPLILPFVLPPLLSSCLYGIADPRIVLVDAKYVYEHPMKKGMSQASRVEGLGIDMIFAHHDTYMDYTQSHIYIYTHTLCPSIHLVCPAAEAFGAGWSLACPDVGGSCNPTVQRANEAWGRTENTGVLTYNPLKVHDLQDIHQIFCSYLFVKTNTTSECFVHNLTLHGFKKGEIDSYSLAGNNSF